MKELTNEQQKFILMLANSRRMNILEAAHYIPPKILSGIDQGKISKLLDPVFYKHCSDVYKSTVMANTNAKKLAASLAEHNLGKPTNMMLFGIERGRRRWLEATQAQRVLRKIKHLKTNPKDKIARHALIALSLHQFERYGVTSTRSTHIIQELNNLACAKKIETISLGEAFAIQREVESVWSDQRIVWQERLPEKTKTPLRAFQTLDDFKAAIPEATHTFMTVYEKPRPCADEIAARIFGSPEWNKDGEQDALVSRLADSLRDLVSATPVYRILQSYHIELDAAG